MAISYIQPSFLGEVTFAIMTCVSVSLRERGRGLKDINSSEEVDIWAEKKGLAVALTDSLRCECKPYLDTNHSKQEDKCLPVPPENCPQDANPRK